MRRATIAVGAFAALLLLLALVVSRRPPEQDVDPAPATAPAITAATTAVPEEGVAADDQGFLYGRITTVDGAVYEGRLRWGGEEEAFWGDPFNGVKAENPWAVHVPPERLPTRRRPIKILGFEITRRERPIDLSRPFAARFGDIERIEAHGRDVRVLLKSGVVFDLDRLEASDFDDGARVWDSNEGVVDLDSLRIRTIDLLPTPRLGAVPSRLHGTVHTRQGDFTGFIQWNREAYVGSDELAGQPRLRFDTLRSIARRSRESSLATLLDGREIELSGTRGAGQGRRGIYVDDGRYGRVLISWDAFERVDFSPGGSGPAYRDFPPGRPLTGSVTTRAGRRIAGLLIYDLDESTTIETLEASSQGVDYALPFGLIAAIVPAEVAEHGTRTARVILHTGEALQLEPTGDLGEGNAGLLIFVDGQQLPEYVPWNDVEQIDLDRPPEI